MSFIIAKIWQDGCVVFSDTKISLDSGDKSIIGNGKLRFSPEEGILKIHILSKYSFIAFAGIVHTFQSIMAGLFLDKIANNPNSIQSVLKNINDETQLILGIIRNRKPHLAYLDKDRIEYGTTFHLGSHEAFNSFQSKYHENLNSQNPLNSTSQAFNDVIKEQKIAEVGDFTIFASFNSKYNAFLYNTENFIFGGYKVQELKANIWTDITFGNANEGSFFLFTFISDNIYKQAVCIFFKLGNVAFLYFPVSYFHWNLKPYIIKASGLEELKTIVKNKYDINLIGLYMENDSFRLI